MNQLFICEYNNCNKYLSNPIILPCCKTVCNEHIKQQPNEKFNCDICKESHQVSENRFPVSKKFDEIIKSGIYFSGEKKKGQHTNGQRKHARRDIAKWHSTAVRAIAHP